MMKGYIALSSIIVIASVLLVIGTSVTLYSISDAQVSVSEKRKEETIDFVESCVEDALLRFNEENLIPSQIILPEGSCNVTINSQNGNNRTFTVSGNLNNYTKIIRVQTNRGSTVTITSWTEV